MTFEEKQREEAKRDAQYDAVTRWRMFQKAVTEAEALLPPHLRRNRPRWHPWQHGGKV